MKDIREERDGDLFAQEDILPFGWRSTHRDGLNLVGGNARARYSPDTFFRYIRNVFHINIMRALERRGYPIALRRVAAFTDMPKFFHFSARCGSFEGIGIGLEEEDAARKAVAEAVERAVFGGLNINRHIVRMPRGNLPGRVLPADFLLRYYNKFETIDKNLEPVHWVKCMDGFDNKSCWLPAQIIFWGAKYDDEAMFLPRTSSGCASGSLLERAFIKSILELIERDALMISWLKMIIPQRVVFSSLFSHAAFSALEREFLADILRYKFDVHILRLSTEFPVEVFCVVLRDSSGRGPAVSVGVRADFSVRNAIMGAVLEALGIYAALRHKKPQISELHTGSPASVDFEGRKAFWSAPEAYAKIQFFLEGPEISVDSIPLPAAAGMSPETQLSSLLSFLKQLDFRVFLYRFQEKSLEELGFYLSRAIIPALMPLYMSEKDATLHHPRIRGETALNVIPHPLI